ncbi:hypothetical protein EON81_12855, partial [bacterium]
MTPAQFWRASFGSDPWTSLAGDADGDGRADLLALGPSGESGIEIVRTSAMGKPFASGPSSLSMGKGMLAVVAGPFVRSGATDILAVFSDGAVRTAWG